MKRWLRIVAATATTVMMMSSPALADTVEVDGDALEPVGEAPLDLGTVCLDETATGTALLAVRRAGDPALNPNSVFAGGATLEIFAAPATATLAGAVPDPSLTLPANWLTLPQHTRSDAVEVAVTFTPAALGSFEDTVRFFAKGTAAQNGNTIQRNEDLRVLAEVIECYDISGFFPPVNNLPAVNQVKAGRNIPMKWSLGGVTDLNAVAPGYPRSQQIPCGSSDLVAGDTPTNTPGRDRLKITGGDQYHYNWKTERSWAGTCRQFVLLFDDGSFLRANFRFK